jgi:hypothetical protein
MLAMHRMFLADDLVALIVVTVYPLDPHSSGWNRLVDAHRHPDLRALAFTSRLFQCACDENLLGRCL